MADTVRRVDYYYVTVPDKPGEGERILSALKESEINLLAYLGFPSGDGQSQDSAAGRSGHLQNRRRTPP